MLFNSLEFFIFLTLVFVLYWFVINSNLDAQNAFLVVASYFFYGCWDWRFLGLIIISSTVDYIIGLSIYNSKNTSKRKLLLMLSIFTNLGILGFFKYFNFFIDSFNALLSNIGLSTNIYSLKIILPIGISFYTFQTLSYTVDIYNQKIKPTKNIIVFFCFCKFLPPISCRPY